MINNSIVYFRWAHTAIHSVLSRESEEYYDRNFMSSLLQTFIYLSNGFLLINKKKSLVKNVNYFYRNKAIDSLEKVLKVLKDET